MNIETRQRVVVNTDPQRRCYNGCNKSEELQWTPWEVLEYNVSKDSLEQRLTFWVELNDYAVSQRGKGAKREFREVECHCSLCYSSHKACTVPSNNRSLLSR